MDDFERKEKNLDCKGKIGRYSIFQKNILENF